MFAQPAPPTHKDETLAIHYGYEGDPTTKAVAVPIYQNVAFAFDDSAHAYKLFNFQATGHVYARSSGTPTGRVLERRVTALEGGLDAVVMASGSAAIHAAVLTLAGAGDNIISTPQLYGGTHTLFAHMFPRLGIQTKFAKDDRPESLAELIDEKTKLVYCESIGNPAGNIADVEKIAQLAHAKGVPVVVDNTVASPALFKPIKYGADIVVHSLTKYIGGHGNSLGGIVVDSGKFPWTQHKERFPFLTAPDPSYHGAIFTEFAGPAAFITAVRAIQLRNGGAALAPMNAFLLLQGLETLSLRMERHVENAMKVAQFLKAHDKVSWVSYGGLPDSPYHALAVKYMRGTPASLLSFGLKDGFEAGVRFYDALKIFKRLVNIGDAKSLACHPASTTHSQLGPEDLKAAGVPPEMIRLSIGIEHIDDLLADLQQALEASAKK